VATAEVVEAEEAVTVGAQEAARVEEATRLDQHCPGTPWPQNVCRSDAACEADLAAPEGVATAMAAPGAEEALEK